MGRSRYYPLDRAGASILVSVGNHHARAGRWPLRGRGKKGLRRSAKAWPPTGPQGQRRRGHTFLCLLAEAYGKVGQPKEGLAVLTEALAMVDNSGERMCEAELYRLKGELTLQKFPVASSQSSVTNPQSPTPNPQTEAEACFLKAIEIARRQQAKSLELRASTSLAHLWQRQGKHHRSPRSCWPRSTAGSLKDLIPRTCKRRKRCWKS